MKVLLAFRVNLNTAYIELGFRMNYESDTLPPEIFIRRKELLDEVQKVIDLVEPGYTRRRGKTCQVFASIQLNRHQNQKTSKKFRD